MKIMRRITPTRRAITDFMHSYWQSDRYVDSKKFINEIKSRPLSESRIKLYENRNGSPSVLLYEVFGICDYSHVNVFANSLKYDVKYISKEAMKSEIIITDCKRLTQQLTDNQNVTIGVGNLNYETILSYYNKFPHIITNRDTTGYD